MSNIVTYTDNELDIITICGLGPYDNNAYLLTEKSSRKSVLVDMPSVDQRFIDALSDVVDLEAIVVTHWHLDHWEGYNAIHECYPAPIYVGDKEINIPSDRYDHLIHDGEEIAFGSHRIVVLHTPGHTPGSISLHCGKAVLTGDTLFAGGPGHTDSDAALADILQSIESKLLVLEDSSIVYPGHGIQTTIANAKNGYAALQLLEQVPHAGDISWPVLK